MQTLDQNDSARLAAQQRTLSRAWMALNISFILFILMLIGIGLLLRWTYAVAMRPLPDSATVVVRERAEWVAWRPIGRTIYQGVDDGQLLTVGDSVRAVNSAGYGQVASIRLFEQSQLDLWAGAEVTIEAIQASRWHSGTLEVMLRHVSGYIRYDLQPNETFEQVRFVVAAGDALITLAPGGSYSIDLRPSARPVLRVDGGNPLEADLAVRTGVAIVEGPAGGRAELRARDRVVIDPSGTPGLVVPARWSLIRDGGFSQFSELEYNNTTLNDPTAPQSQSWKVYAVPALPLQQRGFFRLVEICRPPIITGCSADERRTAAWFFRSGSQTTSFTTGVKQDFGPDGTGVDISEFRSLRFTIWLRVLNQSLPDTGDRGSECPVMVRLVAKRTSPADPEEQRDFCAFIDKDMVPPRVAEPGMEYYRVREAEWAQISFDLREPSKLPDYRFLLRIQIFAQGHDYDSRVTDVSLIGEQ